MGTLGTHPPTLCHLSLRAASNPPSYYKTSGQRGNGSFTHIHYSLHFKPEEYNTTSLGAQLMPHFQEEATKTPRRDMSYLRSPCAMARSSVEPGAGPWHTLENLLKKHELQTNWVPSPCLPITHSVPGSTFLTAQPQFISCSKYQLL